MGDCCSKDDRDIANQALANSGGNLQIVGMQGSPYASFNHKGKPNRGGHSAGFPSGDPPVGNQPNNPITIYSTLSPVEQVDLVKSRLKVTRDRIHNLRRKY